MPSFRFFLSFLFYVCFSAQSSCCMLAHSYWHTLIKGQFCKVICLNDSLGVQGRSTGRGQENRQHSLPTDQGHQGGSAASQVIVFSNQYALRNTMQTVNATMVHNKSVSLPQMSGIRCQPACGISPPSLTSKLSSKLSFFKKHLHISR